MTGAAGAAAELLRVRYAPVGTHLEPGLRGHVSEEWKPTLPGPGPSAYDGLDVTDFGSPVRPRPLWDMRWEFAAVVDLVDASAGPVRVWLPKVQLHRADFGGPKMVAWFDPLRPKGGMALQRL